MSDKETPKFEAIPAEAMIDIKMSGAFHKRLVGLYFNLCKKYDNDKLIELAKATTENKLDSLKSDDDRVDAYSLETMYILLRDVEKAFRSAGHIVMEELRPPNEG